MGCFSSTTGLVLVAMLPTVVGAQTPDRHVTAERVPPGEIRIDGRLDEAAWRLAPVGAGFTQSHPRPGELPHQRTEFRVLYDDANLYVGVRLHDSSPERITAPLARRDDRTATSDWVHVIIDSRYDRRTAWGFSVNPRGVQRDLYFFDDNQQDESWVGVWEVATTVDSAGWTAEYRIPLSQLRFDPGDTRPMVWGLQVGRDIAREGERSSWSPWTPYDPGFVSRFGTLGGLEDLRAPRRLEVVPYVSPRVSRVPEGVAGQLVQSTSGDVEAGADVRVGLPRALTLSATFNPDFGQVEADPAEVNLTAFETLFAERRPFFTEGIDAFRFGEPRAHSSYAFEQYLYSRRIGRPPQRSLAGAGFVEVDAPLQTRILGAGKVSGRTPGGWSVGFMNALTARETARVIDGDGARSSEVVEPLTNYLAGRVRRDIRGGGTTLGGLMTATNRDLDADLSSILHRSAYVVGANAHHTWADRAWSLSGHVALSEVRGDAEAIARTQRDPVRYLHRPDADHLRFDLQRTRLRGHLADLSVSYTGDWMASLQLKEISPGFEINDLGFQTRADARSATTFLGRRDNTPRGILREQFYWVSTFNAWNLGGDMILGGGAATAEWTFTNQWRAGVRGDLRPSLTSDRLTRGGPLAVLPSQREVRPWVQSDPRGAIRARLAAGYWDDAGGSRARDAELRLTYQPIPSLRAELAPRISRNETLEQYVATATADDDARYIFARLDHTTASAEVRADWTFSPTLSLQVFAEPFVSAGRFTGFKEFTTPGGFHFDVYGIDRGTICLVDGQYLVDPTDVRSCPTTAPAPGDSGFSVRFPNPDFHVRSLRTNTVLRWEYRSGSTLFVVWQQDRSGVSPHGDFELRRDLRDLFGDPARHVLLLKLTYWFGG